MASNKKSSVRDLDLDDLDQVVGGATAAQQHMHDPSQDTAFMASLHGVAAVVGSDAAAVASHQETAQAAIGHVEAAAQAQHISTDAALTGLLGATHGDKTVATELTSRLVSGAAATELVGLVHSGTLQVADVNTIVSVATGTLAAYSADGHSALGMSQQAAVDVIGAKIDTAAHALSAADQHTLDTTPAGAMLSGAPGGQRFIANADYAAAQSGKATIDAFASAFESQNATQLATEKSIENMTGGASAFQAGLAAAAANPLAAQSSSVFGETASIVDALGSHATTALVSQIIASGSNLNLANLEGAAQSAHVSTDLVLAVTENLAQTTGIQQSLGAELTGRLASGAAETELVHLAATGALQVSDLNAIVNTVTGTLAAGSADGQSALGMSQHAAIEVIDAKIDRAAKALLTDDQATLGQTSATVTTSAWVATGYSGHMATTTSANPAYAAAQAAVSGDKSFLSAFESQDAAQLAAGQSIQTFEGGASALQAGLNAAVANPFAAQSSSAFGETASIVDALGSHATTALVSQMVAATSNLNLASLEGAAQSAHVSTDLVLALTENLAQNTGIQQSLATELTNRFTSGAAESELVRLATAGTIQVSDVNAIVNTVAGALASASPDGQTALGGTRNAAIDMIDAKIDSAAQALLSADQATLSHTSATLTTSTYVGTGYSGHMVTTTSSNPVYTAAQAAVSGDTSFVSAFEASQSAQIGVGGGLSTALASGTIDQSLLALDQKLGGNVDVETTMAARLAGGAAVSDLAHQVQTGATSAAAAATLLEAEAEAGKTPTAPISALASLEAALGGNASVEAEMARLVTNGGATATAAFQAIEATAKAGTIDTTLAAFDKALGGNAGVEAEMAARLSSGASTTDLAAGLKAGTISATGAVSAIETEARTAHASIDGALTGLDAALGGNATVEAEMSARLTGGAAASDLAGAVTAGTITTAAAISTLEAEATQAHVGALSALAGLEKAFGGNTAVEAEMGKVIGSGTAASGDVGAAIAAVEAVAKPGTIDATLTRLDQAAGGNAAIEAEMTARLANGAAAADQATGVKAGTLSASNATTTLENEAKQAHVGPLAALAALETAVGGNATIEKEIGGFIRSASTTDIASAIAAVEGAAKTGTVDATLTRLDQAAGGNAAVEAEMTARIASGAATTDQAAGIKAGTVSVASAISTLETEAAQSQSVSHKVSQDPGVAALAGLERALGGNASLESEMAHLVQKGGNAAPAIAAIEATAKAGTVDATLGTFDKMAGGNAAVESEMASRLVGGAAAADLAAGIKANTISAGQAANTLLQEAGQAHATTTDMALVALDAALGGNAGVEQIMTSRLASGQTLTDLAKALSTGSIGAVAAITAIEAEAKVAHGSVDATLLAFDTAIGGNASVETEMMTRFASGATASDLASAIKAGLSPASAIAAIESIAKIAHTAPDVALLALDQGVGGNASVEAEMASRVSSGQAASDLAAAMKAGLAPATAIATLEAEARLGHASVDTALLALDTAVGGNAAVETEMATRLASGATATDLASAVKAGLSPASAIATIESIAKIAHTAPDVALLALDQGVGGNAAVEAEMASRVSSGQAASDLAAAMKAGLAPATAIATLEAEARLGHASVDTALLALDTAAGGNAAVETEMATRLASGATATDLAAAIATGSLTAAGAIATLESVAKAAHGSTDAALLGFDKALGGNAAVEAEITARLANGAAATDLAAGLAAGTITAATAITTIEAEARIAHVSVDAALVALDAAAGGNTAVEAEMASRLASGATVHDLAAAIAAGTIGAAAAISMIEAVAHKANGSADVALLALDQVAGGNAAVEAEMAARLQNGTAVKDLAAAMAAGLAPATAIAAIEAEARIAHVSTDAALVALDAAAGGNTAVEAEMASRLANGATGHDLAAAIAAWTITAAAAVTTVEAMAQKGGTSVDLALIALDQAAGHNATVETEIATRLSNGATTANLAACVASGALPAVNALAIVYEALHLVPGSAYPAGVTPPSILNLVTALNNAVTTPNTMLQAAVTAATAMLPTTFKPASSTDPIYSANSSELAAAYYTLFGGSAAAVHVLGFVAGNATPITAIEALASAGHSSIDAGLLSYTDPTYAKFNSTPGMAITTELANRIANGSTVADLAANITLGTVTAQSAIATIESAVARINQTAALGYDRSAPVNAYAINSADVTLAALDKALGGNAAIEAEMAARVASGAAFSSLAAAMRTGQISGATAVSTIEAAARAAHVPPDLALCTVDKAVGGNAVIEAEMSSRYNSGATVHDTAALVASGGMTAAAAVTLLEQVATAAHAPRIMPLTALDKAIGGDATVEAEIGKLVGNGQAEIEIAAAIAAGTMSQADGAGLLTAAAAAAHADPTAAATLLFAAQNTSDPNAGHVCRLLLAAVGGSTSDVTEANFEMGIPYSGGAANSPAVLALAQAVTGGMPLANAENILTALGHVAGVAPDAMITLLPVLADAFSQAGGKLPSFGLGDARTNDGYAYTQPYASLADGVLAYFAEAGSSLAAGTLASHLNSGQTVNGIAARVVAGTLTQDQATTLITSYATIAKVDLGQSLHSLTNAVNALTLTNDIAAAATAITGSTSTAAAQAQIAAIEADAVSRGSTADSALQRLFGLTQGNAAVVQEIGSRIGEMTATEGAQVASGAITAQAAIAAVQTFATEGSHSVADALGQLNAAAPGNTDIAAAVAAAVTQEALLLPSTLTSNTTAAISAAVKAIAADPTTASAAIAAVEQVAGSQTNAALLSLYSQSNGNAAVATEINNRLGAFIANDAALVANGTMAAETAIAAVQNFATGSHSVANALTQLSSATPGNTDIASAAGWAVAQEATLAASTLTSGATNAIAAAAKAIQTDPTTAAAEIAAVEQAAGSQTNIALLSLYNQTHGNAAVSAEINTRMGTLIANEGALVANGTITAEAAMAAVQTFAAAGQHSFDDALGQLMAVVGNNPVIAAAHLTTTLGTAVTAIKADPASATAQIAAVEAAATVAGASIDTVLMTLYGQTGHNAAVSAEIGSRVGEYVTSQAVLVASGAITSDAASAAVQAFAAAGNVSTDVALSQLAAASQGNAAIAASAASAHLTATLGTAIAAIKADPTTAAAQIAAVEAAAGASTDMALMTLYAQTGHNAAVSAEIGSRINEYVGSQATLVASGAITGQTAVAAVEAFAAAGNISADTALTQLASVTHGDAGVNQALSVIEAAHLTATLGAAVTAINAKPASATAEIAAVEAAATAAGASIGTVLMTLYGQTGHNAAVAAEIGSRVSEYVTQQAVLVASGAITGLAATAAVQAFATAGNFSTDVALSQLAAASQGNAAAAAAAASAHLTATLGTAIAAINADPTTAAAQIAAVEAAAGASSDIALMTLYAQTGHNAAVSAEIGSRINEYVGSQATLVASGALTGQAAAAAVQAFAAAGNVSADSAVSQLVSATHGDAGVNQALSTIQAQEAQRAESLSGLVDINNQIAAGKLSQADAIALLVSEDAHGAGLTAAQFTSRLTELQAVQSFASRTGDYQFNNTASLVMQLIGNSNASNSGGYIRDQLNQEFASLPSRLSYPDSDCSVADALTLIHVVAMALGRSTSDFVNDVVDLGHRNKMSPDSLLINYAASTGNDPGLISAMATRVLSGQAQTDLANAVAAGTISASDALTLLKTETALVQSAGAAAHATVLTGPLETNVVAAQFQIAIDAAHAAAVANLAFNLNAGGYPDAATFVRINPWEQPLLDAVNHTAALQTALAADPVMGTVPEMAGQLAAQIINSLGLGAATAAIQDGLGLAQTSTSTAAAQQMVADITTQANAAGVSVDEALMLANIVSGGQNQTLTGTMAGRLLDGSAEAGMAQAAAAGTLDGEFGNTVLKAEVQALASLNPAQNALGLSGSAGLNAQSVAQLVEAKYDLAVSALAAHGNAVAAKIETALEANHAADIIAGMQTFIQLTTTDASHAPTTFTPTLGGADAAATLNQAVGIESTLQTVQVSLLAGQCVTALGNGASVASVLSQIAGAAQSTHLSQDQVLLALDKDLTSALAPLSAVDAAIAAWGGTTSALTSNNHLSAEDALVRNAIMSRVSSGTAASDLYACVQAGTVAAPDAVQALVSAVTVAQSVDPHANYDMKLMSFAQNNPQNPADAIVIPALSDRLIMGQTAATLVAQAITGTVSNNSVAAAMTQIQTIIDFVEGHAGDPNVSVLPGQFEAEVVLGRMVNAANAAAAGMSFFESLDLTGQSLSMKLSGQWSTTDSHEAAALLAKTITSTYGIAAATGQAIIPFVDALGAPMSATALQAGQSLVVGATLQDQNAQAVILGTLQNEAIATNGSIDAAFTLAEYGSGGGSALLTYAMTQRLANGAAEANVAQLIHDGHMDVTTGLNVLLGAVNAVAATNANQSVLGLDQTTASELVIAKLDLAAAKLDPGGALQTTLETNYAKAIIAGLGAYTGLSGDGSTDTSMFGGAATKADLTLAGTVLKTVITHVMVADFADGQAGANALLNQGATVDGALDVAGNDAVSNFQQTFNNATQLAAFEKKWSVDNATVKNASDELDKKIGANLQTSLTINTDPTSSVGTNSSVSAFTSGDFGNGVTAVAEVEAGYDTGAQISNTGVAAHANAGAAATETFQFGHNVSLTLLTESIASGSVSVGVNGVSVSATVGVMSSATIDQTSDFNAGNGFSGMQDTQLQAEIGASAQAGGSLTLSNIGAHFGAMAGDYFSATETAAFSSGGFTVGASAGVMSPGVAGLSIQASTSVDNGNVSFSLGATVGVELFGVNLAANFTLPTGVIVNGIETLGNDIGNTFKSAGGDIANFGEKSWNSVEDWGSGAWSGFKSAFGL